MVNRPARRKINTPKAVPRIGTSNRRATIQLCINACVESENHGIADIAADVAVTDEGSNSKKPRPAGSRLLRRTANSKPVPELESKFGLASTGDMFPRGVLICLGFRQRRPNVRRTAQCRDFSDISKRARQPGRSNRGPTGTTKFVKVLLSNRAHNSRGSETNSPPGVCWMSRQTVLNYFIPSPRRPSPKPPSRGFFPSDPT